MYMNLDTLPAGQAMFTALVGDGDDFDEIDFVASRRASLDTLLLAAIDAADGDYDGLSVAGLIDQSAGEVLFQ